ncbi:MAG: hypothetical protein P1U35_02910 [Cycloclasticus sp.]|nr:hypothetical protein [Cycloclasticus sp.]
MDDDEEKTIEVVVNKANLSEQQANILDEDIARLNQDTLMIRTLTKNNMIGVEEKLKNHTELSMFDHKNAQDVIDKAGVTLGVISDTLSRHRLTRQRKH